jgi:hypothetical protein
MSDKFTTRTLRQKNSRIKTDEGFYWVHCTTSDILHFINADSNACVEIIGYTYANSCECYLQLMRMTDRVRDLCGKPVTTGGCYAALLL